VARATLRGLAGRETLDVLILEVGLRERGDAAELLRAVVPDILVLLPLAPSFPNDLSFLETIQEEVRTLARAVVGRGGTVFACADDPRVLDAVAGLDRVRRFGREQAVETETGLKLSIDGRTIEVVGEVVGDSSLYSLLVFHGIGPLLATGRSVGPGGRSDRLTGR
jgi:UDP-N-acetylmuramyl pentapeptide synthase